MTAKAYLLKIRGGVEVDSKGQKAGKGPLIQEEVSATLGTNQDQYLFQPILLDDQGGSQMSVRTDGKCGTLRAEAHGNLPCVMAYSFDALSSNSMKSKNPHSGCREVEISKTIDTSYPDPSKNQGGIAIVMATQQGGAEIAIDLCPTITAAAGMSGNNKPCVCVAGFKPNQGAKAKGVGYEKEKYPTLLAGQEPAVCISFEPGIASRDGGHVYEGVSGTLRATPGDNQMTVAFTTEMTPKVDTKGKAFSLRERDYKDPRAIVISGTVQTLTSRCGTGGGNVPMVLEPVCFQQNQREEVRIMDVLGAITAESGMHNTNYVVFSKIRRAKTADDFETWGETGVCNTLNTFDNGDVRTNECVICLQGNGIDRADTAGCNGKGWTENVSYTLNTIDRPAVAYCNGNGQVHDAEQRPQRSDGSCHIRR